MSIELASRGLRFREQLALPVTYKGHEVGFGHRIDSPKDGFTASRLHALRLELPDLGLESSP